MVIPLFEVIQNITFLKMFNTVNTTTLLLHIVNPNKPFVLETKFSGFVIQVVLHKDGIPMALVFTSKSYSLLFMLTRLFVWCYILLGNLIDKHIVFSTQLKPTHLRFCLTARN